MKKVPDCKICFIQHSDSLIFDMDRFIIELKQGFSWNVCRLSNLKPQLSIGSLGIEVEIGLALTRGLKHESGHPPALAAGFKIMADGISGNARYAHW